MAHAGSEVWKVGARWRQRWIDALPISAVTPISWSCILACHENLIFSMIPVHAGMRQYWRNFDALERRARSEPHRAWWKQFIRDSGGTGFWHETYFMRGGMFSARDRARRQGDPAAPAPFTEADL